MSEIDLDDDAFAVGDPLPEIASVMHGSGRFEVAVTWKTGSGAVVDIAPDIFTFKAYAPLRDDHDLFKTVHVVNDGSAIGWGMDDSIDMPATAIERLVKQAMTTARFQTFLSGNKFTRDAAAAQLGISRRLVGYYASGEKRVPRHIALACAYLSAAHDPDHAQAATTMQPLDAHVYGTRPTAIEAIAGRGFLGHHPRWSPVGDVRMAPGTLTSGLSISAPTATRAAKPISAGKSARRLADTERGDQTMKQPGLDHRHRDKDGEISKKHGNTEVKTLRETYGDTFAKGFKPTDKLKDVLEALDEPSLTKLVKDFEAG